MIRPRIDTRQMVALLFLSRVFAILTLSPKQDNHIENGAAMLGIFLSGLVSVFLVYFYQKLFSLYPGDNLLDCCWRVHPIFGGLCAVVFWLLCIGITISTAGDFQYFLTSAVYPYAGQVVLVTLFVLAILYSAYMGLEAFSRLSLVLCGVVLLSTLLVVVSLSKDLDFVYLLAPLRNGMQPVLKVVLQGIILNMDLFAFLLLSPMVREKHPGHGRGPSVWGSATIF